MNCLKIIIALVALSVFCKGHAQPHVHEVDENVDASRLNDRYLIHSYESHQQTESFLPSRDFRDQLFRDANLESAIERFDELDRDLIFKKVQKSDVSSVLEDYPSLSSKKRELKKLKDLIRKEANR